MTYGLQVLDSSGTKLLLDISDRTVRIIKTQTSVPVPTGAGTTSVTVSGVATTDLAVADSGAMVKVTAANTVTVYGTAAGGTTTLKILSF